jgi:CHAD domain-containing protein
MAKSGPTISPGAYAAGVLLDDLKALRKRLGRAHGSLEVKDVHQLRIASRRLRNALELFADDLPGGRSHKWVKHVGKVTGALGAVRDLDVQIDLVRERLQPLRIGGEDTNLPGLERLLLRLAQRRRAEQEPAAAAVRKLTRGKLLESMRRELRRIVQRAPHPTSTAKVKTAARHLVRRRLQEWLAYERFVHSPHRVEELHRMRIAAKHLRYTLEAYQGLLGAAARRAAERVHQFQSVMGDIHDADVWLEFLPRFIQDERQRYVEFFGHTRGFTGLERGLRTLIDERVAQRQAVYRQFVVLWDKSVRSGYWRTLGGVLTPPAAS